MEESGRIKPVANLFRRKGWRICLSVLALFVVILVLFHVEEDMRANWEWRSWQRQQIAQGDSFDPKRLIPAPVPPERNFAMTPFLAPLLNPYPDTTNAEVTNRFWRVMGFGKILPETNSLPRNLAWPAGESHALKVWAVAFEQASNPAPPIGFGGRYGSRFARVSPTNATHPNIIDIPASEKEAAAIILDHLKSTDPIFAELRNAEKARPYCQFTVRYDHAESNNWEYLSAIKQISDVLSLRISAEVAAGRAEEAYEDMDLALYLCDAPKGEWFIIPAFVRETLVTMARSPLADGLATHFWSEPQLAALQTRWEHFDLLSDMVRSLYGERDSVYNPAFNRLHPTDFFRSYVVVGGEEEVSPFLRGAVWLLVPDGWPRFEQLNYNRAFHDTVLPRFDLTHRVINPAVGRQEDQVLETELGPWDWRAYFRHASLARLILHYCPEWAQKTAFAQNTATMAATACALERYRLAHGEYPASLNDLVPQFMSRVPQDIINGEPLKYRREPNGKFVLYSVGWNEKDDNGSPEITRAAWHYPPPYAPNGDWVWEQCD